MTAEPQGEITNKVYRRAGEFEGAINQDAEEVCSQFDSERATIERLFQRITAKGPGGRPVRDPIALSTLAPLTNLNRTRLAEIVKAFAARDLLVLRPLKGDDIQVDLPHECLAVKWHRLKRWIDEEAVLADSVSLLKEFAYKGEPLTGRNLSDARGLRDEGRLHGPWPLRYLSSSDLSAVIGLIDKSEEDLREKIRQEKERRRAKWNRRILLPTLGGLLLLVAFLMWEKQNSERQLAWYSVRDALDSSKDNRPDKMAAYLARALRHHPDSLAATSWISDLLLNGVWWIPSSPLEAEDLSSVTFSPDGRALLMVASNTVQIWDSATLKVRQTFPHSEAVKGAKFSQDGHRVVTVDKGDKRVRVWSADLGKVLADLENAAKVNDATLNRAGSKLIIASNDGIARVWDVETGKPTFSPPLKHSGAVLSAKFSPDGTLVVTASADSTAQVWDTATGKHKGLAMRHNGQVNSATFNEKGSLVVTASNDKTAQVWDATTGKSILPQPPQHKEAVLSASFSPSGLRLVTASADKTAQVWDATTGKPIGEALKQDTAIVFAAFSRPDGPTDSGATEDVLTVSNDHTAQVWDAKTGLAFGPPLRLGEDGVFPSFSPDGYRVLAVSADHKARLWHAVTAISHSHCKDCPNERGLAGHRDSIRVGAVMQHYKLVRSAAFDQDGNRVITASDDGTAQIWLADDGSRLGPALKHAKGVQSAVFSPDGRRVLTASDDTAQIWDAATGRKFGSPLKHAKGVQCALFSPDGRLVATASADNTAQIWDAASGRKFGPALTHAKGVQSVAFSPDGSRVVTASDDNTAQIWGVADGKSIGRPMRHNAAVFSAAFSQDGLRVITASADSTSLIWDARGNIIIGHPMQHGHAIFSAAFSPDGLRAVTASEDGTANVWDIKTRGGLRHPLQHRLENEEQLTRKGVLFATFSPDGQRVVTAGADGISQVWDAASGEPLGPSLQQKGETLPVVSVSFSPDGSRVLRAFGNVAQVSIVQIGCAAGLKLIWHPCGDQLADLAEAVAGVRVSNEGELTDIAPDERWKRLNELIESGRSVKKFTVEWVVQPWARAN